MKLGWKMSSACALALWAIPLTGNARPLHEPSADETCNDIAASFARMAREPHIHDVGYRVSSPSHHLSCRGEPEPKVGISNQTYRLASVGKMFTAAMVLKLWENGAITSLDEKLVDVMTLPYGAFDTLELRQPEGLWRGLCSDPLLPMKPAGCTVESYGPSLTIRHLLQHASGLPDHIMDGPRFREFVLAHPDYSWSPTEILKKFYEFGYFKQPFNRPGEAFHYSDMNYVLLGLLIEAKTGMSLAEAAHQLLFAPLALKHTFLEWYESQPADVTMVDTYVGDANATHFQTGYDFGGGGWAATLDDQERFMRSLFLGGVFEMMTTLARMATDRVNTKSNYGLGLTHYVFDGVDFYGHGGAWGNALVYAPAYDLTIAFSVNQADSGSLGPVFEEVAGRALAYIKNHE